MKLSLVLGGVLIMLVGCGGSQTSGPDDEVQKPAWEFEVEFCEAQDGYATTQYNVATDEIEVQCTVKDVCYAYCKPGAEYCPQTSCDSESA